MANKTGGVDTFIKSVIEEVKKVVWPTRQIAARYTIMVIISVAVAVLVFASLDYALRQGLIALLNRQ
jgi:preprotein translocase subunit SecE